MVRAVRSSIAEPEAVAAADWPAADDFLAFFNGRGRTCDMMGIVLTCPRLSCSAYDV